MTSLQSLRSRIDEVDAQVAVLLAYRLRLVEELGREKRISGMALRDEKREQAVLQRVTAQSGVRDHHVAALESIYREVMRASLELQHALSTESQGTQKTRSSLSESLSSER